MRKVLGCLRKAVTDFHMIENGDKIAVGVSGGKDSLLLLRALALYRNFSPQKYELCAVTAHMGLEPFDVGIIRELCNQFNIEYRVVPTEIGKIVEKYLLSSENIPGVKFDRYVIMPDHIHVIIFLYPDKYVSCKDGSSKAPTPTNEMLPHIVSTFKRFCNKEIGNNIFQRGYIEHIIRDKEDYETRSKYIYENPARWYYDGLFAKAKPAIKGNE